MALLPELHCGTLSKLVTPYQYGNATKFTWTKGAFRVIYCDNHTLKERFHNNISFLTLFLEDK